MRNPFGKLITESSLAKLAGERSFARGTAYFDDGAVVDLVQSRGAIKARVIGSDEYRVVLRAIDGELEWLCSCPHGEDGAFCKHAVATGLSWLSRRDDDAALSGSGGDDLEPLRVHLASQSREALVDWLVEQAGDDPELHARLQASALRSAPPSDMKSLKEAVRRAMAVHGGFVDYHGMRAFLVRADSTLDLLNDLLRERRAAEALMLADYAMRRGIAAYERCDDSGGGFGNRLRQVAALHLEACRAAKPDGQVLGAQLFELQMIDQWGFFDFGKYAPYLGEGGIARYRTLAERSWSAVPVLKPGDKRAPGAGHYVIAKMMEGLARHAGDVDALVAVKSRDLSHPHAFLEIVAILSEAERHDEALAWAERARKSFPDEFNAPLAEFLVEAYGKRGDHQEAVEAAWHHFNHHPALSSYRLLEKAARGGGIWSAWRGKALSHLRDGLKSPRRPSDRWHWTAAGHSLLVEIFLYEGDSDAALAEARTGACTVDVLMKLARAREERHPQDAVAIYQARIDPIVDRKNNQAYDEAVGLIGKIERLSRSAGSKVEFDAWFEKVKARHKAKRNFIGRLHESRRGQ